MTPDKVLDDGFDKAEARMAALRLTPKEFVEGMEGLSYVSYWRSKTREAQAPQRTKVLRKVEAALDKAERNG